LGIRILYLFGGALVFPEYGLKWNAIEMVNQSYLNGFTQTEAVK